MPDEPRPSVARSIYEARHIVAAGAGLALVAASGVLMALAPSSASGASTHGRDRAIIGDPPAAATTRCGVLRGPRLPWPLGT